MTSRSGLGSRWWDQKNRHMDKTNERLERAEATARLRDDTLVVISAMINICRNAEGTEESKAKILWLSDYLKEQYAISFEAVYER